MKSKSRKQDQGHQNQMGVQGEESSMYSGIDLKGNQEFHDLQIGHEEWRQGCEIVCHLLGGSSKSE